MKRIEVYIRIKGRLGMCVFVYCVSYVAPMQSLVFSTGGRWRLRAIVSAQPWGGRCFTRGVLHHFASRDQRLFGHLSGGHHCHSGAAEARTRDCGESAAENGSQSASKAKLAVVCRAHLRPRFRRRGTSKEALKDAGFHFMLMWKR